MKKKVIFVTDGDIVAKNVIEEVAKKIGGRTISKSAGNPTPLTGSQLVSLIKETPHGPVFVMFDDNGRRYKGKGETAMEYIANHPDIEVIGAIAVASNTQFVDGTSVDFSVDQTSKIVDNGVDKDGRLVMGPLKVYGDTVDILDQLNIPIIIGIGDIGKMKGHDHLKNGSPVTLKAIQTILEWSESHEKKYEIKKSKTK